MAEQAIDTLRKTPLHAIHEEMGGKMVPFAGYEMPVQFEGVKPEHLWTREHAGLFDVSHMGPCFLYLKEGLGEPGAHEKISALIERLVPSAIATLKPGQGRLTVLLNDEGGILDDLIITRMPDENLAGMLYIVVNGAVKQEDWALIREKLGDEAELQTADDRILVALQGPEAEAVLSPHFPEASELSFMRCAHVQKDGERYMVSRCGYTGEDGFELLLPANETGLAYVRGLLADERVKPIGLGARDSLRLEAGLCLYGNDLDDTTSPSEGSLLWVIAKRRRTEAGGFVGSDRILAELPPKQGGTKKVSRKRAGFIVNKGAPARSGAKVFDMDGAEVGVVTSGGMSPCLKKGIGMVYVKTGLQKEATELQVEVRGKMQPITIAKMPFVEANYYRGA